MKTLNLPQNTISNASKKAFDFYNNLSIGKAQNYISSALNEGLKQNLLGTEINMEFLLLSVRSYSGLLYNMFAYRSNSKNN